MAQNEEQRRKAVAMYYYGSDWAHISSEVRISERTLRSWAQTEWWEELYAQCEVEEPEYLLRLARRAARNKLIEGDGTMARFILERRDPAFRPPNTTVTVEGHIDHSHERKLLAAVPTEVLERLADGDKDAIDVYFEEVNPSPVPPDATLLETDK